MDRPQLARREASSGWVFLRYGPLEQPYLMDRAHIAYMGQALVT